MLTAQDMSYDEARNLHSKWQKHQAFMAELASNKDWLDKIDKVWTFLYSLSSSVMSFNTRTARGRCIPKTANGSNLPAIDFQGTMFFYLSCKTVSFDRTGMKLISIESVGSQLFM